MGGCLEVKTSREGGAMKDALGVMVDGEACRGATMSYTVSWCHPSSPVLIFLLKFS